MRPSASIFYTSNENFKIVIFMIINTHSILFDLQHKVKYAGYFRFTWLRVTSFGVHQGASACEIVVITRRRNTHAGPSIIFFLKKPLWVETLRIHCKQFQFLLPLFCLWRSFHSSYLFTVNLKLGSIGFKRMLLLSQSIFVNWIILTE